MFDRPLRPAMPHCRRTLVMKAMALFLAISALLASEVVLGLQLGQRMEKAADDLADIDRRGQTLLLAASKINDMLYDLTLVEFAPQNATHATLVHLHSHIVALAPIEMELRKEGRPLKTAVGDMLARSSNLQMNADAGSIWLFTREIRPEIEAYSAEVLRLLVSLDDARKGRALWVEQTRKQFSMMMLLVGAGGAITVSAGAFLFFARLSHSLRQIQATAMRISAGDYAAPLEIRRDDELGQVINAVNALSENLAERDRELHELQGRFAHQEKMLALGTFATGMAHEIGNPIQAISALSEQVAMSLAEDSAEANVQANIVLVESITAQAARLARTVSEIRDFAHPAKPEPEAVDVNQLVRNTVGLMRFDPRFRTTKLELTCAAEHSVVEVISDHLIQVVMNLLVNAADAMEGRDGGIAVATRDTADGVEISVEDSGMGMSAEVLQRACTPFFTTKSRKRGTGLGLAICRSIMEEHRGAMNIASTPGVGTTVNLVIPRGHSA
ncbi:MAG: HAMP domain-containing protein [Magnetospirillum sp.]|nr:HAMP domain-containing protein [Magnetospirillum sp.]